MLDKLLLHQADPVSLEKHVTIRVSLHFVDQVACADPDMCEEICNNRYGCSDVAYPLLVVYLLPEGLRGFMFAALIAALMSSLTSMFNSSSTLFTLDIWKVSRKQASERELMIVGRIYTLVLTVVALCWLPILQLVQGSQFWDYVQSIYSHILPPIVSAFVLGLFWSRATEEVGTIISTVLREMAIMHYENCLVGRMVIHTCAPRAPIPRHLAQHVTCQHGHVVYSYAQ